MTSYCPYLSTYDIIITLQIFSRLYFHHAGMTLPGGIWKGSAGAKCAEDGCRSVGFDMFLRWSQGNCLRWFSDVVCLRWFCLICIFSEKETSFNGLISAVNLVISVKFGRGSSSSWPVDCPRIGLYGCQK